MERRRENLGSEIFSCARKVRTPSEKLVKFETRQ